MTVAVILLGVLLVVAAGLVWAVIRDLGGK
jgi:hypothetical protein